MERSTSSERLGRNERLFRDVNERIREVAMRFGVLEVSLFICECSRGECAEAIQLELEEYDAVRSSPGAFVIVPGHETGQQTVVVREKRYNVVVGVGKEQPARLHEWVV